MVLHGPLKHNQLALLVYLKVGKLNLLYGRIRYEYTNMDKSKIVFLPRSCNISFLKKSNEKKQVYQYFIDPFSLKAIFTTFCIKTVKSF